MPRLEPGPVHGVLPAGLSQMGRDLRIPHPGLPGIPLLAPDALPGAVAGVVGSAAVLPVVLVVGDQVGVHAALLQQLRHGVVKGLQRPPAAVEEVIAAGVQLPPGGHAGHGAHIAAVKLNGMPGQPLKIGGQHPVTAIGGKQMPVQRVKQ